MKRPGEDLSPPARAARAAANLAIVSVRLTNFSALTSHRAFDVLPENVTSQIGFTAPEVRLGGMSIAITTTFLCRLVSSGQEGGEPVFDLRATTELVYRCFAYRMSRS